MRAELDDELAALELQRAEASRRGDWALVTECCERQLAIRPDLLLPRLRIAWRQARDLGGSGPERELDACLDAAVGSHQMDHSLVRKFLMTIQQSADASRHQDRLCRLMAAIDRAPVDSFSPCGRSLERSRVLLALDDREGFLAEVERRPAPEPRDAALGKLTADLDAIGRRWRADSYPDYSAPKVFVIGLSRTGTTSMDAALRQLGFTSAHWLNHLTMDILRPADFLLFDALSDTVITAELETLAHQFPNARFVMTTRSYDSWAVSVERHYRRNAGVGQPSELLGSPLARTFRGRKAWVEASVYAHHETWEAAYDDHARRVAECFSGDRQDRLLKFDATVGDGWASLCSFLDRPIPDVPYPHANKGKPVGQATVRPGSSCR